MNEVVFIIVVICKNVLILTNPALPRTLSQNPSPINKSYFTVVPFPTNPYKQIIRNKLGWRHQESLTDLVTACYWQTCQHVWTKFDDSLIIYQMYSSGISVLESIYFNILVDLLDPKMATVVLKKWQRSQCIAISEGFQYTVVVRFANQQFSTAVELVF